MTTPTPPVAEDEQLKIKAIRFPNTIEAAFTEGYEIGTSCDEIKRIVKTGEMAGICWLQIWTDGKPIAEIKESICNIYLI